MHTANYLGIDLASELVHQGMKAQRELLGIWASLFDTNPFTIWGRLVAKDIFEETALGFPSMFGPTKHS